jgi:hypothetical protein
MLDEEKLDELLVEWELSRQNGQEVSAEELCREAPELLGKAKQRIASLKATSWMFEPEEGGGQHSAPAIRVLATATRR